MKHLFCLFIACCFFACSSHVVDLNKSKELDTIQEIICQHPRGHIIVYKVSKEEARLPFNFRGGLWSFKTVDGRKVKTTNCHLEVID